MNYKICDVCYYQRDGKPMPVNGAKLVPSKYRITYKKGANRLGLDVCEEHSNFFKVCKTFEEAQVKVDKLYGFGG